MKATIESAAAPDADNAVIIALINGPIDEEKSVRI
jgi:hypothetical protein